MAITGAHALLYTPEAEALGAVLRDGLQATMADLSTKGVEFTGEP